MPVGVALLNELGCKFRPWRGDAPHDAVWALVIVPAIAVVGEKRVAVNRASIVRAAAVRGIHDKVPEQQQCGTLLLRPKIAVAARRVMTDIKGLGKRILLALHNE